MNRPDTGANEQKPAKARGPRAKQKSAHEAKNKKRSKRRQRERENVMSPKRPAAYNEIAAPRKTAKRYDQEIDVAHGVG